MNLTNTKIRINALLWLVLIVVGACDRSSDLEASLELAEKLIASHPDSVLTLLDSIPQSTLTTRHDQARYALLYTEALDKNHLVPTDDSLISLAVRYFEETNNMPQLMEAYYYHGRVKYHNGNFPQALLSFYKAKEMAVIVDSNFRAGMSCRGIADIYRDAYNRAEELAFAKKEYEYIKKSGKQPYLDYALYDLGVALDNNSHHKESLAFARQLIDSARLHEDSYLRYAVLQLGAISLIELGEYEEAYPMLAEICAGEYAMTDDSLHYCRVLVRKGMYGEALALLDSISDREPGVKNMIRFDIFKATGQYDKAVEEAVQADQVVDSILQSSMSHNLAGSLSEYYEMDQRIRMAELEAADASEAAAKSSPTLSMPPLSNVTFKDYENFYSVIVNSPDYISLASQQMQLLGDMSLFNEYIMYFESGINHNLIINKHRVGLSDTDIIVDMFDAATNDLVYSDEFQTQLAESIRNIVAGNIDYNHLFSDRKTQTTSLSQKKAGEVMRLYVEAISNMNSTLSQYKLIAHQYISTVSLSKEIGIKEKQILLNSFPIAITSGVLWTSIFNQVDTL